jgi:hypothetical protein
VTPAPESWRIVVATIPGGVIFSLVDGVVRPGPPRGWRCRSPVETAGSPAYLEVVEAVPPGIDVIVSNHQRRAACQLRYDRV